MNIFLETPFANHAQIVTINRFNDNMNVSLATYLVYR